MRPTISIQDFAPSGKLEIKLLFYFDRLGNLIDMVEASLGAGNRAPKLLLVGLGGVGSVPSERQLLPASQSPVAMRNIVIWSIPTRPNFVIMHSAGVRSNVINRHSLLNVQTKRFIFRRVLTPEKGAACSR